MTIAELALNWITNDRTGDYCNRKITLDEATWSVEHMDPDDIEDIEEDLTPEAFMEAWNDIIEEDTSMKTKVIFYPRLDREIELTSILYRFRDESIFQEGILVHDSSDEFHDGDSIFGNGWKLEYINDATDLDSLFGDPSEGTNYFHRNFDGTYTIDA